MLLNFLKLMRYNRMWVKGPSELLGGGPTTGVFLAPNPPPPPHILKDSEGGRCEICYLEPRGSSIQGPFFEGERGRAGYILEVQKHDKFFLGCYQSFKPRVCKEFRKKSKYVIIIFEGGGWRYFRGSKAWQKFFLGCFQSFKPRVCKEFRKKSKYVKIIEVSIPLRWLNICRVTLLYWANV
jgi:hypothetical protein